MGTISGIIYNHDESVRIGGATVRLYSKTTGSLLSSTTSRVADGFYSFTIGAGRYFLVAFKDPGIKAGITGPIDVI